MPFSLKVSCRLTWTTKTGLSSKIRAVYFKVNIVHGLQQLFAAGLELQNLGLTFSKCAFGFSFIAICLLFCYFQRLPTESTECHLGISASWILWEAKTQLSKKRVLRDQQYVSNTFQLNVAVNWRLKSCQASCSCILDEIGCFYITRAFWFALFNSSLTFAWTTDVLRFLGNKINPVVSMEIVIEHKDELHYILFQNAEKCSLKFQHNKCQTQQLVEKNQRWLRVKLPVI